MIDPARFKQVKKLKIGAGIPANSISVRPSTITLSKEIAKELVLAGCRPDVNKASVYAYVAFSAEDKAIMLTPDTTGNRETEGIAFALVPSGSANNNLSKTIKSLKIPVGIYRCSEDQPEVYILSAKEEDQPEPTRSWNEQVVINETEPVEVGDLIAWCYRPSANQLTKQPDLKSAYVVFGEVLRLLGGEADVTPLSSVYLSARSKLNAPFTTVQLENLVLVSKKEKTI